jgi:hypothetical protein
MFKELLSEGITAVGTLQMNKKGIPPFLKEVKDRLDNYTILYEIGGKLTIHSWVNKNKKGNVYYYKLLIFQSVPLCTVQ